MYLLDPCLHYLCVALLILRFWIIFTIFILSYFSGRLPASPSFVRSCGCYHVPSSAACFFVFLFCLIHYVCHLLSAGSKTVVPLICDVFPPWVGLDPVRLFWLGELVPVFLWMELYFVFLKGSAMSSSEFGGFWGLGILMGRLSANRIGFLFY